MIQLEGPSSSSSLSTTEEILLKELRGATFLPTLIAQLSGHFPFTVTALNSAHFCKTGIHFVNLMLQSFIGTVCPLFCIYHMEFIHAELAKDWSSTEKIAYGMIFNIISISKVIIRMLTFVKRKEILRFHRNFNKILKEIFEKFTRFDSNNLNAINQWLIEIKQSMRCIWALLIILEAVLLPLIIILLLRVSFDWKLNLSITRIIIFITAMAICIVTGVLYATFLYWLVSIIHCIQVGFQVLGQNVLAAKLRREDYLKPMQQNGEENNARVHNAKIPSKAAEVNSNNNVLNLTAEDSVLLKGPQKEGHIESKIDKILDIISSNDVQIGDTQYYQAKEEQLTIFMSDYSKLETLVADFNEVFKYHISIILLGCCSSWILHTFVLVSAGMKEGIHWGAVTLTLWVLLDTAGIVSVCNVSCKLANQAKGSINIMREVALKNFHSNIVYGLRAQIHLSRASDSPVQISPGNFFVLKRSVIISIYAMMTTYVFVVLQFQEAEQKFDHQ